MWARRGALRRGLTQAMPSFVLATGGRQRSGGVRSAIRCSSSSSSNQKCGRTDRCDLCCRSNALSDTQVHELHVLTSWSRDCVLREARGFAKRGSWKARERQICWVPGVRHDVVGKVWVRGPSPWFGCSGWIAAFPDVKLTVRSPRCRVQTALWSACPDTEAAVQGGRRESTAPTRGLPWHLMARGRTPVPGAL